LASRQGIAGIKIINAFLIFLLREKCQNWIIVLETVKIERQIVIEKQIICELSTGDERNGTAYSTNNCCLILEEIQVYGSRNIARIY